MGAIDYYYFIIDISESMQGNKIGSVNDAINNLLFRLKRIKASKDITPKIVMLTFSDNVNWLSQVPIDVNLFTYTDLTVRGKASSLREVLKELDNKLKRQAEAASFAESNTTILFFTDGLLTDDWADSLLRIGKNETYQRARKLAVTFSDELTNDISIDNMSELVGKENVVVDDFVELNRLIFEQYK